MVSTVVNIFVAQDLSAAYGEHLMESGRYHEAGLILARCGKCERALTAFEECLEWRQAIMMAARINLAEHQLNTLARCLASE